MTRFQKKEQDAVNAFQKEMDKFGLQANRNSFSGTYSYDGKAYNMEISTIPKPVKGQKTLIEKLEAAGYTVYKWKRNVGYEIHYFVFTATKVAAIPLEDGDDEECQEKPERPGLIHPEIGKTYENRGGGTFRCVWSVGTGGTFINTKSGWRFQAVGVRQYKDGTIEWDFSNYGHFAGV